MFIGNMLKLKGFCNLCNLAYKILVYVTSADLNQNRDTKRIILLRVYKVS